MILLRYITPGLGTWRILILSILLFGCRKEEDQIPPRIVILEPESSDVFQYNNIIPIRAHISDDQTLKLIRINITNQSGTVFLNTISIAPQEQTHFEVNQTILFDDLQLASGTYYVTISASDGVNTQTAFSPIILVEAPRVLKRVLVLTHSGTNLQIDTIANNAILPWKLLPIQYHLGTLYARSQILSAAHSGGQLSTFNTADLSMVSTTLIPNNFGNGYFRCIALDAQNGDTFFGCTDGTIKKMNSYGQVGNWSTLPSGLLPNKLVIAGEHVAVICQNLINTARSIVTLNKNSGVVFNAALLDFDAVNLLQLDATNVLIVGNAGNTSEFKKYQIPNNQLYSYFTPYNTSPVAGCWQASAGRIIVAHADGLVLYNGNLNPISSPYNLAAGSVRTNVVNGQHYVITPTGVHLLNATLDQELTYIPLTGVVDLLLEYNK